MANRPVFVPQKQGNLLVSEVPLDFTWNPGFAVSQKKKNIAALHEAAEARGLGPLLEVSSKSEVEVGRSLSAFSLELSVGDLTTYLECAYQGSKVFQNGGPFTDLFNATPREAKRDPRLASSGPLIRFELQGQQYPLEPKTAFYDWLYIKALMPHGEWIGEATAYVGFTDIEFNPKKSVNCQARALAELIALAGREELERAESDFSLFASFLNHVQTGTLI